MIAATGESPAAVDLIRVFPSSDLSVSGWNGGGCRGDRAIIHEDPPGDVILEPGRHDAVRLGGDHHAPAGGSVRGGDRLDRLQIGSRVDFGAADGGGDVHIEEPRLEDGFDDRVRELPRGLNRISVAEDQGL